MEKHQHQHHHRRELHLLPIPPLPPPPPETSTSHHHLVPQPPSHHHHHSFDTHVPPLDLQLSINLSPYKPPPAPHKPPAPASGRRMELLRWQAAEQMRLAMKEKADVERVREMTRREMEMAQSELARAQILWERTTEELARAERIKLDSIIRLPNYPPQSLVKLWKQNCNCGDKEEKGKEGHVE